MREPITHTSASHALAFEADRRAGLSGRDNRNGSNGHFWPRGRFRAIQTPLPAVLMQSLSTCRRSTLPGPLPPVEVVRRTARARQKGQILAKSRELTGDQFNVTLCNLQWQGSKESSRDASGTPWIAPIRRNDDEPCLGAHLIGSHRIGMVRAPPKWVQIDSDSSF